MGYGHIHWCDELYSKTHGGGALTQMHLGIKYFLTGMVDSEEIDDIQSI